MMLESGRAVGLWEIPENILQFHAEFAGHDDSCLYLYDSALIRSHCQQFLDIPYESKSIHFATMANVHPEFLRIVRESGLSAFVNSVKHLELATQAGFDGDSIVFAASAMDEKSMRWASRTGAQVIADSLSQLEQWVGTCGGTPVGIRCNIGSLTGAMETRAGYFLGSRSRLGFTPDEIRSVAGHESIRTLHLYVGTDLLDVTYFLACYEELWSFVELFPNLTALDFGGGFGLGEAGGSPFDVESYGLALSEMMTSRCRETGRTMHLMLEPGRIIGGDAGYFFCRVSDVKLRGEQQFVGVQASCAQFPRPLFYPESAYHPVALVRDGQPVDSGTRPSSVFGCSTYSRDFLARDCRLPEARAGDWVVLGNAGSYCASARTEFLGFPPAREIFL